MLHLENSCIFTERISFSGSLNLSRTQKHMEILHVIACQFRTMFTHVLSITSSPGIILNQMYNKSLFLCTWFQICQNRCTHMHNRWIVCCAYVLIHFNNAREGNFTSPGGIIMIISSWYYQTYSKHNKPLFILLGEYCGICVMSIFNILFATHYKN